MTIKVFVLIAFLSMSNSKSNFMPNLPLGEYRIVFEKIYSCESTNVYQTKYVYLSKTTLNKTQMIGNVTLKKPFDNTLTLDLNVASWGSIGGWKPNSMVYITKNACSNFIKVLGNAWNEVVKAFNIPVKNCPIPAGTYITAGVDLEKLEDWNFPKVYFYGKYRATFKLKNEKNKVLGCYVVELSLIRPWEKPI